MNVLEDDILHPLATLEWEECCTLPLDSRVENVQLVAINSSFYIGGRGRSGPFEMTPFFMSSTDLKSWSPLPVTLPTYLYSLTTYFSQPVLVGGRDAVTNQVTNKLYSLSGTTFQPLLPPMPTARYDATVVSTREGGNCLIVAGGRVNKVWEYCNTVEVLSNNRWSTLQSLPGPSLHMKSAVHNGKLYLVGGEGQRSDHLYSCSINSLLHSTPSNVLPLWSVSRISGVVSNIASFGRQLVMFDGQTPKILALSPLTGNWVDVGDMPKVLITYATVVLPSEEIIMICRGRTGVYSSITVYPNVLPSTYRIRLRVSPYPESQINMISLFKLEEANVPIVTALSMNHMHRRLLSAAGIKWDDYSTTMHLEQYENLKFAIGLWHSQESQLPPTWTSLHVVLRKLNLEELSQQIDSFLHGKRKYLKAYRQILATQECVEMWFIRVILLGAPRLGKTTTRRRLTGEIKDISSSGEAMQPSTGAVESGHNVLIRNISSTTAMVTPTEWLATKDLFSEARLFLQYIYSYVGNQMVVQGEKAVNTPTVHVKTIVKEAAIQETHLSIDKFDVPRPTSVSKSSTPSAHSSIDKQSKGMSEVAALIQEVAIVSPELWESIKHSHTDTAFLNMEDMGGQPEFMDLLPALTIGPALYLFFTKLTDSLQSLYTVSYCRPSGESSTPSLSAYTVKEVLLNVLASISCLQSSHLDSAEASGSGADELMASCNNSIAYIIGTHKDLVSEQQIAEFDEQLQQSIRSTDFFRDGLVRFSSENRMVLPIDNMHGGEDEVKEVRKFLEEGIKKHFKKLKIPASWLVLSLLLRKREQRTASLESVLHLAGDLGIPQKEAMLALWFLHHYAGVLMYFPNLPELKDTVICDNQIIYDSATSLIVNTFKFGSVSKSVSERFRETGLFSLEEVEKATADISGDIIPLNKLVKLLQHINIVSCITPSSFSPLVVSLSRSKEMLFMPSVLQNATSEELDIWWKDISKQLLLTPLFFCYPCGYVPIGVFPSTVAKLANANGVKRMVQGIKKNRVQFQFGSDYDTVTLISQPEFYALHIARRQTAKRFKTPLHKVCRAVRELVESTLKTVTNCMNYDFSAEYQLAFECPSHPLREHLCVVDTEEEPPQIMCCPACPDVVDMRSQHTVWFEDVGEEDGEDASKKTLADETPTLRLADQDLAWICEKLGQHSAKWRQIGQGLRFTEPELDTIEAAPRLFSGAPFSYLCAMLSNWLQRAPGDARGSTDYATLNSLRRAVDRAGLGRLAQQLNRPQNVT